MYIHIFDTKSSFFLPKIMFVVYIDKYRQKLACPQKNVFRRFLYIFFCIRVRWVDEQYLLQNLDLSKDKILSAKKNFFWRNGFRWKHQWFYSFWAGRHNCSLPNSRSADWRYAGRFPNPLIKLSELNFDEAYYRKQK